MALNLSLFIDFMSKRVHIFPHQASLRGSDIFNPTETQIATTPLLSPHLELSGVKVLIVDDCEENQFLFSHLLKRKGAVITTADNGKTAVEKALCEHFDIILMDIQMPVMNGYEAITLLKKANCLIPVIAVTAQSSAEEKSKILEAGFSFYVSKPLDKDALIQSISHLVEKQKKS